MKKKTHYETLGVPSDANEQDIRIAYRKAVMRYHPDRNKGDIYAEQIFAEITVAYRVLINEETRAAYDKGETAKRPATIEEQADTILMGLFTQAIEHDQFSIHDCSNQLEMMLKKLEKEQTKAVYRLERLQGYKDRIKKDVDDKLASVLTSQIDGLTYTMEKITQDIEAIKKALEALSEFEIDPLPVPSARPYRIDPINFS